MGILKVGVGAAQGVLADSWREYFYCDAMDVDVLAKKGEQRQSKRGFNTKKSENIISNGSIIVINEGQCMMIVEQGKVVEVCAEAGEFLYDSATEPSLFYGDLKESIKESFRQFGKRVGFGGDPAGDQRIYYFNTKEILGNKYGTSNPVPFRVVDTNIGLDIDIAIRCHGEYAYHIIDPILFYKNICGNITDTYTRDSMESQLKSEMLTALQPAFGKLSAMGIRYSALPAHTMELSQALNEVLAEKWGGRYGIEITSIGVSSVKASDEDEAMIKELQRNATLRNPSMAAAHLVNAQAEAMQAAAANPNAGPVMAFAGSSFKWRHSNSHRHRNPPRQAGPAAAAQQIIRAISAQNVVRKSRRKMSGFVHAAAIIRGVSVRSAANPSRQACRSIAVINAAGSRKTPQSPLASVRNVGIRSGTRTKSKSRAGF